MRASIFPNSKNNFVLQNKMSDSPVVFSKPLLSVRKEYNSIMSSTSLKQSHDAQDAKCIFDRQKMGISDENFISSDSG